MMLKDKPKLLPVRRGLIERKHYERMGDAIWLFLFLISIVSWKTWEAVTSYKVIEKQLGISRTTTWRFLRRLGKHGYIKYQRTQYGFRAKIAPARSQEMFGEISKFLENFGRSDVS